MKSIVIAAFFLLFGISNAQQATADPKAELYVLTGPETYELSEDIYTFTPELNNIKIKKLDNKEEVDFGTLRKTTDDGLFIMTSIASDEVSFGRFDSLGNFKTLRYDPTTDKVLEEHFKRQNKRNRLGLKE
ncbi:hypothetical protein [Salinimicrobium xinjiangense]|uniref:hypothetical protein n=1 Tax=Salinimicrobium xinjiangense TaxID=438596 RepID=UPI0004059821|nr:hypothetical protein [Salinimicrobium xinjiangense]